MRCHLTAWRVGFLIVYDEMIVDTGYFTGHCALQHAEKGQRTVELMPPCANVRAERNSEQAQDAVHQWQHHATAKLAVEGAAAVVKGVG